MTKDLFDEVSKILERKRKGQDCTEDESATLKAFIREMSIDSGDDLQLMYEITQLFPLETSEAFEDLGKEREDQITLRLDIYKIGLEVDEQEIISADEVINRIAETLREADGKWIEKIANQVLTEQVEYKGDSMFNIHKD